MKPRSVGQAGALPVYVEGELAVAGDLWTHLNTTRSKRRRLVGHLQGWPRQSPRKSHINELQQDTTPTRANHTPPDKHQQAHNRTQTPTPKNAIHFPPITPPDPVTATYVGVCAAITGGLARAIYAGIPPGQRRGSDTVPIIALTVGALYGLTVWVGGLAGLYIHPPAQLAPSAHDLLTVAAGTGGFAGAIGAIIGVTGRHVLKRDVRPAEFFDQAAGAGIVFGILTFTLYAPLH